MRAVAGGAPGREGRWIWAASGVITAVVIAIPVMLALARAGMTGGPVHAYPGAQTSRVFTVPDAVTAVTVDSFGGPVRITAGPVSRVEVTERISYDGSGGPPAVRNSVSRGRLILADPACGGGSDCSVAFTLTVPPGVSALRADTRGGPLTAQGISAATVDVTTDDGPAQLGFAAAPRTVDVSTGGGLAQIWLPGGPYALAADSGGGPETVQIATDPSAPRSLTVTSAGGPLLVTPAGAGGPVQAAVPVDPVDPPAAPAAPAG